MKISADKRPKIIKKPAAFHNVYLWFFRRKNTISCGGFGLLIEYLVVFGFPSQMKNPPYKSRKSQLQNARTTRKDSSAIGHSERKDLER